MYYPDLDEFKKLSKQGNLIPVCREMIADLETPVSAYLKIARGDYSFLLESVERGQRLARYSFIGTEPQRLFITDARDNTDPLAAIQAELGRYRPVVIPGMPVFCGGAVGYLAYETAGRFENLPSPQKDTLGLPESLFMLVNTLLAFDHVTHKIKIISLACADGDIERAYRAAIDRIDEMAARLNQPLPMPDVADGCCSCGACESALSSNISKTDFLESVGKVKQYIAEGEAIQVVLSQRLTRPTVADPFDIYRALRTINPSPYMFFLNLGGFHIIGASPETLVRVEDSAVMTRPLAGTRPRGRTAQEDELLEKELLADEKERAEHIMLVDLGRNDIGRVSEPGTVEVSDLMNIERYSHVMHLVTHVQGRLRGDRNAYDVLRACLPAGTVSGAPKIRAMEIIAEMEPDKRGPYAGAAGYFSYNGNMDMAITIRTMIMAGENVSVQAGCGIVYDSVPEREYQESMNKARALLKAIEQAEQVNKTGNCHAYSHR